jgi:putative ABC transport system permease protein
MGTFFIAIYLAVKEIWRNRGRFLLFSMVIALITLLVLFIAALGEGLGNNNREYISKVDAQLMVFSDKSDYIISVSRIDSSVIRYLRRMSEVADAGGISTTSTSIVHNGKEVKVSMLGVEANRPGVPQIVEGRAFQTDISEAIIDSRTVSSTGLNIGDLFTIRSTQGTKDQFYTLKVVGITSSQAFQFQPSIFVPPQTWERIRPKSLAEIDNKTPSINIAAVRLKDPQNIKAVQDQILANVSNVIVADIPTTISNIPGYTAQQGTLQTQGGFTMLIGILIIGGFFQIQILQKVPQIGVLKAIGASNGAVGAAAIFQIMIVTGLGVLIGGLLTYGFSMGLPKNIPIVFNGTSSALAILALLLTGPFGGMVSVIYAVRIEPLKALRLSQ